MNEPRPGPVVWGLVITCLCVFGLQMLGQSFLLQHFALWPPGPREWLAGPSGPWQLPAFRPWQLLSYAFLHGGPLHLLLNLFGLYMFGQPVERVLGSARFAAYILICVLGAALAQILVVKLGGQPVRATIGLSGAVFGLLPAFAMFFPRARVRLLFPPIALPAPIFVLLFGALEFAFGISNTLPGIAHFAHLGGLLCGLLPLLWWRWRLLRPRPRSPEPR